LVDVLVFGAAVCFLAAVARVFAAPRILRTSHALFGVRVGSPTIAAYFACSSGSRSALRDSSLILTLLMLALLVSAMKRRSSPYRLPGAGTSRSFRR
jgi:hypothetical protein